MIHNITFPVIKDHAVVSHAFYKIIFGKQRRISVIIGILFPVKSSQIRIRSPMSHTVADEISGILMACAGIHQIMGISDAEIKGALNSMPVLSFLKAIPLIYFLIQSGPDHADRIALQRKGIRHFIAHHHRPYSLRLIFIYTIEKIHSGRSDDRMGIDGKRRKQIFNQPEFPFRRIRDCNPHSLAVLIFIILVHA